MQKDTKIAIAVICAVVLVIWILAHYGIMIRPDYRCLPGTEKDEWKKGELYKVGKNLHGRKVLKYPRLAFWKFQEEYQDAIEAIQEGVAELKEQRSDLEPPSLKNASVYETYAWQIDISGKDEEMQERIRFAGQFLGIYENSFEATEDWIWSRYIMH